MNKTQQVVSERIIGDRLIYRIHDIANETLLNVRLVEETDEGFVQIIDWQKEDVLREYIEDETDITIVSEEKERVVQSYLSNQFKKAKNNFKAMIESIEMGGELIEFVELGGEYFGMIKNDAPVPLRLYHVLTNQTSKIRSYGPLNQQSHFELISFHEMTQVADNSEMFVQYGEGAYLGIQRKKDTIGIITIHYVEKDGKPFLTTAEDDSQFFVMKDRRLVNDNENRTDKDKSLFVADMIDKINKLNE